MTLGGLTRMGKTVFLKEYVKQMTSLITAQPDHTHLYIVDLKGGLEFGPYQNLKQVEVDSRKSNSSISSF